MARMRAPERRRQLLETAATVFARKGYHGATTAELAAAAGVAEPILYRHFKNKLDLFVNLVVEVGREVIKTWETGLEGVDDPQERLHVLLSANPATHERGKGVYRVIFQAMTDAGSDRRIARAIREHVNALQTFVETEIKHLQRQGAVRRDVPASDVAIILVDTAVGYGMLSPLKIANHEPDDGKKRLQELLHELLTS